MYLSMAIVLAISTEIGLGSSMLNHIYKGSNDLLTFENGKLNGMVQVWLVAYNSYIFYWKSNVHIPSSTIYGLLIAKAKS